MWKLDLPLGIDSCDGVLAPSRLNVVALRREIIRGEHTIIEISKELFVGGVDYNINWSFIELHQFIPSEIHAAGPHVVPALLRPVHVSNLH